MRVQLAWTMLTELGVMLAGILLLNLAASLLGDAGFGEYTVSRRAVALLQLPLVLGLGIAAPRYIAIARAGAMHGHSESGFAIATLTAGLLPAFVVAILLNTAPELTSTLLFGTDSLTQLVAPASIALAGLALHSMVYAVYRGRAEMGLANAMQLINLGVVPLAAFALAERDAAAVLTATGTGWLVVSAAALLHVLYREREGWGGMAGLSAHLRVLLRFGLPRVPGEFALVGLFAIPALIAVRAHGVVTAGHFSAAMSLLTIVSGAFAPIGLVVLPHASAQAAKGDIAGLRRLALRILVVGILLATAGVIVGELAIPPFIRWYFGESFMPAVPIFRACLIGAVPYVIYILMRSILDAVDVKALNSRNLIIALFVVVALSLANSSILWMAISLVIALAILAALTLRDTYARLDATSTPARQGSE